jgi:deferrochelatase/peroxidase EfeB
VNTTTLDSAHAAPPSAARRHFLLGLGAGALGTAALGAAAWKYTDPTQQTQPFYGRHQAGITTEQPAAGMVVAFDVLSKDKAELTALFKLLTERLAFLTQGGKPPEADQRLPPMDSGIVGPMVAPDNLTATLSVGASLFDERFGLRNKKPIHLERMTAFPNDQLNPAECHGDLLLQLCANTTETNLHALRDIIKHSPKLMAPRWKLDGFLPPRQVPNTFGFHTARNLLGFKDGSANLDIYDEALMNDLVWVNPKHQDVDWTAGGSYQAVRIIRNLVERWDRTPLKEQQHIFGRQKASGALLGQHHEHEEADFGQHPETSEVPLDAHIRLANPRTMATQKHRILRRGYNYDRGLTQAGQMDMGLLFICYQANLQDGFINVQTRLNGENLEEYIKPTGGGYFFALPGVASGSFLGASLLA